MYYCVYDLNGKVTTTEVFANDRHEAVSNALGMFGESVQVVMESSKPYHESMLDDCKVFWIQGMSQDIVTDNLTYNTKLIRDMFMGRMESVKKTLRNGDDKEFTLVLKALVNQSEMDKDKRSQLMDMVNDTKLHDVVKGVFFGGMVYNSLHLFDCHEALLIAVNYPELLKETFDSDISSVYVGSSYKNMKKAYNKYESQLLTFFGFGLYASLMIEGGGLTEKGMMQTNQRYNKMIDEINRRKGK